MEDIEQNGCISCIKDGKTGVCRAIKDKTARNSIEEVTAKVNEVVETVNNLSGGGLSGDFVKKTDIATSDTAGIVRVNETYGARVVGEVLDIVPAQYSEIDNRQQNETPLYMVNNYTRHGIVPSNVDYAVKKALADNKLKGTKHAWTEEEKASARELLGIDSGNTGDNPSLEFAETEREKSKNLLGLMDSTVVIDGVTFVIENGKIIANGSNIKNSVTYNIPLITKPVFSANKTYCLSIHDMERTSAFTIKLKRSSGTYDNFTTVYNNVPEASFTVTEDIALYELELSATAPASKVVYFEFKLQLEEGAESTNYQPYNGPIVHQKDMQDALANASGPKKYIHNINIEASGSTSVYMTTSIITNDSETMTLQKLAKWLYDNSFSTTSHLYTASGGMYDQSQPVLTVIGLYSTDGSTVQACLLSPSITTNTIEGINVITKIGGSISTREMSSIYQCYDTVIEV